MFSYNPKISVVIPAYKAANYLAEAIDSALAQTYDNFEIIVVNDGSPDDGDTRAVAEKYGDKIRYFEKENGGSSSALNRGIEEMTGEWFSWLSHDDLYKPRKLERQVALLNELYGREDVELERQIIFAAADFIDQNGKLIRTPKEEEMQKKYEMISSVVDNKYIIADSMKYNSHGCSCLIHKTTLDRIGRLDEGLRIVNDIDLWYRLYVDGCRLHYIPEVLVSGRVHSKQVSMQVGYSYHNSEQDMYWRRNLNWLLENCPNEFDLLVLFGKTAYEKTRFAEGKIAFEKAKSVCPQQRKSVNFIMLKTKTKAKVKQLAKWFYLKLFVRK